MTNESLQLLAQWFQNLGLLLKQNIDLPANFAAVKELYHAFLNLEIGSLPLISHYEQFRRMTQLDVRVQFLIFNALLPLAITVCTMILFKPLHIILWYAGILVGVALVIVGVAFVVLQTTAESGLSSFVDILADVRFGSGASMPLGWLLFLIGILLVLFLGGGALVLLLIRYLVRRRQMKKAKEEEEASTTQTSFRIVDGIFNESALPTDLDDVEKAIEMAEGFTLSNERTAQLARAERETTRVRSPSIILANIDDDDFEDTKAPLPSTTTAPTFSVLPEEDSSPIEFAVTVSSNTSHSPNSTEELDDLQISSTDPQIHQHTGESIRPIVPLSSVNASNLEVLREAAALEVASVDASETTGVAGRRRHHPESSTVRLAQKELNDWRERREKKIKDCCQWNRVLKLCLYGSGLVIVGLVLAQWLQFGYFTGGCVDGESCCVVTDCMLQAAQGLCRPIGLVSIVIGASMYLHAILLWFRCCRSAEVRVGECCERNALKIVFLLLSIFFTPIISSVFGAFVCKNFTCPAGSSLPMRFSEISVEAILRSELAGAEDVCVKCDFHPLSNCSFTDNICPEKTRFGLLADASVRCFDDMAPYLWGPAISMGFVMLGGLPCFYCIVTKKQTRKLAAMEVDFLLNQNIPLWIRDPKKARKMLMKDRKRRKKDPEKGLKRNFRKFNPSDYMWYFPPGLEESFPASLNPDDGETKAKEEFPAEQGEYVMQEDGTVVLQGPTEKKSKKEEELESFPPDPPYDPPELACGLSIGLELHYGYGNVPKKILQKHEKKLEEERWKIRTVLTNNPIKSLYNVYSHRWRFFRILNTFFKTSLVFFSTTLVLVPKASSPLVTLLHLCSTVLFILTTPYMMFFEDLLNVVVAISSTLTSAYLILPAFDIDPPDAATYAVMVLNGVTPVIAIVAAFYSFFARRAEEKHYRSLIHQLDELQATGRINVNRNVDYGAKQATIRDVDMLLTDQAMKGVLIFFLVLGVFSFLALVQGSLGLIGGVFRPRYIPSNGVWNNHMDSGTSFSQQEIQLIDFIEYDNWTHMNQHCCCQRTTHHEMNLLRQEDIDVELWSCDNGRKKERVRSMMVSGTVPLRVLNGSFVRPFCGREFVNGWQIEGPSTNGDMTMLHSVQGGDPTQLELPFEEEVNYLVRFLW